MFDLRYILLIVFFLIFFLAGVILIAINLDNLEAAIPLFAPAGAALFAMVYLYFCVKDDYDGGVSSGTFRSFGRRKRGDERLAYSQKYPGSRYDDKRSRYDGSRYEEPRSPRRADRSRYDDDRSRYERSRYDDDRSRYEGSKYDDDYDRRPKRKRRDDYDEEEGGYRGRRDRRGR